MRLPAKYTEVLKNLIDCEEIKPLIDRALSTYPMYVPENEMKYSLISTREELNKKLLNHYKYREIGFETVGRFIDELEIAMNEIMPYYYQLYKSADVMNGIDDVFGNVDITEKFEQITEGSSKGNSKGSGESTSTANATSNTSSDMTNTSKDVTSQTPQDNLGTTANNIDSVSYADEIKWNKSTSNSEGTSEDNSTSTATTSNTDETSSESTGKTEHTFTKQGNQGVNTYAHDMKELRETFLNIDKQIIEDPRIAELFMLVY